MPSPPSPASACGGRPLRGSAGLFSSCSQLGVLWIIVSQGVKNPTLLAQNVLDGLKLGFVYALIALGYTMVYGIVKLINFAHGDVFMVGAFTSYFAVSRFGLHKWPSLAFPGIGDGLSIVIGSATVIILSMVVCTLLAITIERVAYKPLRDAPRIAALITAIGVSFFLEYFGNLQFVYTARFIPYKSPFDTVAWYIWGGVHRITPGVEVPSNSVTFSNIFLIIMAASIVVQIVLQFIVRRTKIGMAMRASSFDKPTARLMGINVDRVISFTFASWRGICRPGRSPLRDFLRVHHADPGHHPRPQGICRRRARRHRQHPRRIRRGAHHGAGGGSHGGLHLHSHA